MRFMTAALTLAVIPSGVAAQNMYFLGDGQCAWATRSDAVWGASIRGVSSEYDETQWSAARALGKPDVFPRFGDIPGAWAPGSRENVWDYIDILFPQPVEAGEVWVFETNGGGVYLISALNPDGSTTVLALEGPGKGVDANHIVVPVNPRRTIVGVRVATSSAVTDAYAEIDAVAALPTRPCSDDQDLAPSMSDIAVGTHLTPSALPRAERVAWASAVVEYGSQYNAEGWAATQALGAPDVFPNFGDLAGAWAPAAPDLGLDLLALEFPRTEAREIWIYETFGVGGVWAVIAANDDGSEWLWATTPSPVSTADARVLRIELPERRTLDRLTILASPRDVGAYTEIDAVGLVP